MCAGGVEWPPDSVWRSELGSDLSNASDLWGAPTQGNTSTALNRTAYMELYQRWCTFNLRRQSSHYGAPADVQTQMRKCVLCEDGNTLVFTAWEGPHALCCTLMMHSVPP